MCPAQLIFVDRDRTAGLAVFNPNAFPEKARPLSELAAIRAAMFRKQIRSIGESIDADRIDFLHQLEELKEDLLTSVRRHPDRVSQAFYASVSYFSALNCALYSLKSLLDVYANLVGRLHGRGNSRTFRSKTVSGTKISGGALIGWLRESLPSTYANTSDLADLIESHSRDWITDAISLRDHLAHKGGIEGFIHMSVNIREFLNSIPSMAIEEPRFPDGLSVIEFSSSLNSSTVSFLRETFPLLPDVDVSLVSFDRFSET